MPSAPRVEVLSGPRTGLGRFAVPLAAMSGAAAASLLGHAEAVALQPMALPLLMSVGALAAAGLAWRATSAVDVQALRFDGQAWHWNDRACAVEVRLDLQCWLLLRCTPVDGGRAGWLAPCRRELGADWHLFRTIVRSARPHRSLPWRRRNLTADSRSDPV